MSPILMTLPLVLVAQLAIIGGQWLVERRDRLAGLEARRYDLGVSEHVYETVNGVSRRHTIYTPDEIRIAWKTVGDPRNKKARQRGRDCVVVHCSEGEAYEYVAQFVRLYACPTCTHYDGRSLSMYCGEAGPGTRRLMRDVRESIHHVSSSETGIAGSRPRF